MKNQEERFEIMDECGNVVARADSLQDAIFAVARSESPRAMIFDHKYKRTVKRWEASAIWKKQVERIKSELEDGNSYFLGALWGIYVKELDKFFLRDRGTYIPRADTIYK